ncbi:Hsp70 family protein [Terrabacter sp. MAHUQ-38]|uniref:Hsp70 family protein n=1 Tax=unclassified Terrabacter TaxID=2630222 RepID=UPI00165DDD6F|nr:Hsp70 family protein [Terrabacter sp. MAHUQ-38]MBC9824007.1 Hsp70 family protein [Terrabacter sp. MAHUQ-38]
MDLGLDFGTTHTVVAYADRGNYPVVSFLDEHGDARDHFPSVVADDGGTLVYGFAALEAARRGMPSARSFKRLLAEPGITPATLMRLGDREVPLFDVLTGFFAAVLDALRSASSIEGRLDGAAPARAMVGAPAQANSAQRFLTLEACRRAGFDVAGLVNEPSAASFEFAHRQARSITSRRDLVIVYDLGGGTFDASLLQLSGTRHEVLDSFGVNRLGGEDFDKELAAAALRVAGRSGTELSEASWASLLEECREAKERIGPQSRRVAVEVPAADDEPSTAVTVPVDDFYAAVTPLVAATTEAMDPLVQSLRSPEGDGDDLQGVAGIYIVGGASGLPLVPRLLRSRFGRRVHRSPMPSASTAVGLAIAADPDAGFSLHDRLSRGFGVFREREGGAAVSFDPVLDRSLMTADALGEPASAEPVVVTRRYRAAHNIGWFRFVEYSSVDDQGEPRGDLAPVAQIVFPFDPELQRNHRLSGSGTPVESSLARGLPIVRLESGPLLEERYTVDPAGIIELSLTDLTTGYRQEHVLHV